MSWTLLFGSASGVLGVLVIGLAIAYAMQSIEYAAKFAAQDRKLDLILTILTRREEIAATAEVPDASPKRRCDVDIFGCKVFFSAWELRDIIDAVAIGCSSSNRRAILSKARDAFQVVNAHCLERGLPGHEEPAIDHLRGTAAE